MSSKKASQPHLLLVAG